MENTGLPESTAPWRAVVAALLVAVIGLGAHAQAGAEVSAAAAAALTLGLTAVFAGVAAGRLPGRHRSRCVRPRCWCP